MEAPAEGDTSSSTAPSRSVVAPEADTTTMACLLRARASRAGKWPRRRRRRRRGRHLRKWRR
jgi:hypothetical protein